MNPAAAILGLFGLCVAMWSALNGDYGRILERAVVGMAGIMLLTFGLSTV